MKKPLNKTYCKKVILISYVRLSQGFGGTGGKRAFISGEQENKDNIGNRKHKQNFRWFGEQAKIYQGNKRTGTPLEWEGLICTLY